MQLAVVFELPDDVAPEVRRVDPFNGRFAGGVLARLARETEARCSSRR